MNKTCMLDHMQAGHMARFEGERQRRLVDGWVVEWTCGAPAAFVVDFDDEPDEEPYYLCGAHAKIWNWREPTFRDVTPERYREIFGCLATRITCQSSEVEPMGDQGSKPQGS